MKTNSIGEKSRFHPNNQGAPKHIPVRDNEYDLGGVKLNSLSRGISCCITTLIIGVALLFFFFLLS